MLLYWRKDVFSGMSTLEPITYASYTTYSNNYVCIYISIAIVYLHLLDFSRCLIT